MTFVRRAMRLTFTLGTGTFGTTGSTTHTVENLRMAAKIVKAGGNVKSSTQVQVWGLTLSEMNQLSTLGLKASTIRKNTLLIEAGDEGSPLAAVFSGTIKDAWADLSQSPDVPFHVEAYTGLFESIAPATPSSFPGTADVATIMSGFANKMGLSFRNNGVSAQLSNCYFSGSLWIQAQACVSHALPPVSWTVENQTLFIWPTGQPRDQSASVLLDKDHGMIRSPSFDSQGIRIQSVFNPNLGFGTKITVKSVLEGANGDWNVNLLDYDLQAQLPKGKWEMSLAAIRGNVGPVISR